MNLKEMKDQLLNQELKTSAPLSLKNPEINIIIDNGNLQPGEQELYFLDEEVTFVPSTTDMLDLLVIMGIFPSKSQARKNWTRTGINIPLGYTSLEGIGKNKRILTILNPIPLENQLELIVEAILKLF